MSHSSPNHQPVWSYISRDFLVQFSLALVLVAWIHFFVGELFGFSLFGRGTITTSVGLIITCGISMIGGIIAYVRVTHLKNLLQHGIIVHGKVEHVHYLTPPSFGMVRADVTYKYDGRFFQSAVPIRSEHVKRLRANDMQVTLRVDPKNPQRCIAV